MRFHHQGLARLRVKCHTVTGVGYTKPLFLFFFWLRRFGFLLAVSDGAHQPGAILLVTHTIEGDS